MPALAVIPARGGSKGLPRKNIRPLCGKPLIAWTIDAALRARQVGRVVVSTDDPEIASVSRALGAEVIWRPPALAGDDSPSEAALVHALSVLGVDRGRLAFLQCTAPLMLPQDIDGTLELLEAADSAFTATPWHGFVWRQAMDGMPPGSPRLVPVGHSLNFRPRRQDRRGLFLEVGAVYAMDAAGFLKARRRFFGRVSLYPVPRERSVEIDDETDFVLAEALLARRLSADGGVERNGTSAHRR